MHVVLTSCLLSWIIEFWPIGLIFSDKFGIPQGALTDASGLGKYAFVVWITGITACIIAQAVWYLIEHSSDLPNKKGGSFGRWGQ